MNSCWPPLGFLVTKSLAHSLHIFLVEFHFTAAHSAPGAWGLHCVFKAGAAYICCWFRLFATRPRGGSRMERDLPCWLPAAHAFSPTQKLKGPSTSQPNLNNLKRVLCDGPRVRSSEFDLWFPHLAAIWPGQPAYTSHVSFLNCNTEPRRIAERQKYNG